MLAARACYDPKAAVIVFTKLGKKEKEMLHGARVPQFMLTHPLSEVGRWCCWLLHGGAWMLFPSTKCTTVLCCAGAGAGDQQEPAKGGAGV